MFQRYSRRRFIALTSGTAALLSTHGLWRPGRRLEAQSPGGVKVLVEDVRLRPGDLAPALGREFAVTPSGITLTPGRASGRFVSPVMDASAFTHLGLHWVAVEPRGSRIAFEVRTAARTGAWTPWERVLVEAAGRETPRNETFGALLSAPRHTRAQFRATIEASPAGSPLLTAVTATFLNSKDGPPTATTGPSASIPSPAPSTIARVTFTREAWGADETLRHDSPGSELWPPMYVPAKIAVIHHTATTNNYATPEDAKAEVRAIHAYHAQTLGWGDIGYNVLVDRFGNSYEGRYGRVLAEGREVLSEDVVAGHARSHNYGSAGVASLGTHSGRGEGARPGVAPTEETRRTLAELIAWYGRRRSIDPGGRSDFLLSDDGWNRGLSHVPGHRDCNETVCPGGQLYELLPSLRSAAESLLERPQAPTVTASTDTAGLDRASQTRFDWSPLAGERYLEGWRRVTPESEDIVYLSGYGSARLPAGFVDDLDGTTTLGEAFTDSGLVEALEPGHYTLHLRSADGSSYEAVRTVLVLPGDGAANAAPVVSIEAPLDGSSFGSGELIRFEGSASDPEDGDLTEGLQWDSDLDGAIGSGGTFSTTLSDGTHAITARLVDSAGASGAAQVTLTVGGEAPGGPITLRATGYRVRGLQKADLHWSGATSTEVAVFRDGSLLVTIPNSGEFTDHIDGRGSGGYTYRLCEAGTETCSNEATVSF